MEKVVNLLILENQNLLKRVNSLEYVIGIYHEWKKETADFNKYLHGRIEKLHKNRANNNLSDKR